MCNIMRYLGLDLGSVTCGVSKSDTGLLAQPLLTIRFKKDNYDEALDKVEKLVEDYKPDVIVLGYPLLENGDAGPRAKLSEEFKEYLHNETSIPVILQDERCTTKDSEEFLIQADVSRKKRKKIIDQQAAVRILQYYLDKTKSDV